MNFRVTAALALAFALTLAPNCVALARAADAPDIAALLQRLQEQEARIIALERKLGITAEAERTATASAPSVSVGPAGASISSADRTNTIRLRGLLHVDGRRYLDPATPDTANSWILRRVRPTLEGTLNGVYDFRFTPDFGGGRTVILDAYVAARFKPWAVVAVGKFKVPVGLERLQASSDLRFIERAFPTGLVPNRDVGVQLGGNLAGGVLSYSVGYFNGVTDGGSSDSNTPTSDADNDSRGDWAARVFLSPLRGLGFGVGLTHVDSTGSANATLLPTYRTPGQQAFFSYRPGTSTGTAPSDAVFADGERLRVSPQAYYYFGRLGLLGEYVLVRQDVTRAISATLARSDTLDIRAWHVQLSWFLTGEEESFRGFIPASTFQLGQPGWGTVELVARYHVLDIDDDAFAGGGDSFADPTTAASKASAYGVGINWYLNRNIKLSLNYDKTEFYGGAPSGDRPDEEAVLTRFALSF